MLFGVIGIFKSYRQLTTDATRKQLVKTVVIEPNYLSSKASPRHVTKQTDADTTTVKNTLIVLILSLKIPPFFEVYN